ncbi:hypothetical protein, partial [uncultured Jatrophihabitans sp.]|uniref:hypothetical protein n=1 Tax=uncultured Jatrophihabitans sp. TaxID=1610747 RepID=UPI0035C968CC
MYSTCTPSTVAAADTSESASLSAGSSTTRSSVARPVPRWMTSTLRMSAPTVPSAVATAPRAPGRSGSTSRSRKDTATGCRTDVSRPLRPHHPAHHPA